MLTNLIGTAVMVLTTNWTHTAHRPIVCPYCAHPHHYTAEEHYKIEYDVVITNYVDHPSVYKTPPMKAAMEARRTNELMSLTQPLPLPPLPPPTILFRRSNTNGLPGDQIQR